MEFPKELRNNSRMVHFSDALAGALWRRLQPQLAHRDIYLLQPMGFCAEGRWKPVAVNPCFRIARYQPGERFQEHCDGMYVNDKGDCSIYSLVVYLNGDFEGGGLEFVEEGKTFKPCAGSAVLFPHDTKHRAAEVCSGAKYIARSELMFRCVSLQPPPRQPSFIKDSEVRAKFERMSALYEQLGSLAKAGDAKATTEAYQEALGIQIAYKGTAMAAPSRNLQPGEPGDASAVAAVLAWLSPKDAIRAGASCEAWRAAASLGVLWRALFLRAWPSSLEAQDDVHRDLDPELKDWLGLYRRQRVLECKNAACCIYFDDRVRAQSSDGSSAPTNLARANHRYVGIGWDSSFKQRAGWSVGALKGAAWYYETAPAELDRSAEDPMPGVQWSILAELFKWTFDQLHVRPSGTSVVVPLLPGIWSCSMRARLVRLLAGRFGSPRVCLLGAPLCVLFAHGRSTGSVLWTSNVGKSTFCCYHEGRELFTSLSVSSAEDVAVAMRHAAEALPPELATSILDEVFVFVAEKVLGPYHRPSVGEFVKVRGTGHVGKITRDDEDDEPYRVQGVEGFFKEDDVVLALDPDRDQNPEEKTTTDAEEEVSLIDQVTAALAPHRLGHLEVTALCDAGADAVLQGARALMASPAKLVEFEALPEERAQFEWRRFVDDKWQRLPTYAESVLEGAFLCGAEHAHVNVKGCLLSVDIKNFKACEHAADDGDDIIHYRLTRFLRGQPSSTPDMRTPDDLVKQLDLPEIEEVADCDAVTVRTMVGKVVFSAARKDINHLSTVRDLVERISANVGKPAEQLTLVAAEKLEPDAELRSVVQVEGSIELMLIINEKQKKAPTERRHMGEMISEDMPGEFSGW